MTFGGSAVTLMMALVPIAAHASDGGSDDGLPEPDGSITAGKVELNDEQGDDDRASSPLGVDREVSDC